MIKYNKKEERNAMLLQFTVNNYKSIKDTTTFSMATTSKDKGNSFKVKKYELLQSAIVYGANASGKSNFLKALIFMCRIVLNRDKVILSTDRLPHYPFKLSTETEDSSSSFEMVFFIKETKYRYGFELDNSTVYAEWLYADENGKESKLFYRDIEEGELYVNRLKFKEGLRLKVSKNQLFLWKCDQEGGEISASILQWFSRLNMINGMEDGQYVNHAMKQMENEQFKKELIALVKTADIGIEDVLLEEEDIPRSVIEDMPLPAELKKQFLESDSLKKVSLLTHHKKYDEEKNEIGITTFELDEEESRGTQKFFKMSAPILNTLREGKVLIIDELDASLHPMLTKHLIKLFHNKEINKLNAQLIFATHDTNLLHPSMFRRDQIWLTQKDRYGATELYSLAQFKNVRKDEDFEKKYIQGKYGAVPYLQDFAFEVL
jgi:AAA15 family ATPase/GTPase